jgi:hypothetical protein
VSRILAKERKHCNPVALASAARRHSPSFLFEYYSKNFHAVSYLQYVVVTLNRPWLVDEPMKGVGRVEAVIFITITSVINHVGFGTLCV